jgi:hypothetical protein
MIDFYKKNEYRIYRYLSLLLGLIPLIWLRGDIIAGEEFYAINYARWGEIFANTWANTVNYGHVSVLVPFRFQGYVFSLFKALGFSVSFGQILWYFLTHSLTALFFYQLVRTIFKGKKVPGFALFIATVFYTYNPFFLNIAVNMSPPRLLFMFLPVVLLFIYKHFLSGASKYLFYLAVSLFFASPIFVNLPAGSVFLFLIYFYFVYKHFFIKVSLKNFIKDTFLFTIFFLLLNLWWLIPTFSSVLFSVGSIKSGADLYSFVSSTQIYEVFSQFGSWAFNSKLNDNYYYFPYHKGYYYFPLVFLRQLPHFFVLWSLYHLIKKPKDTKTPFYLFLVFVYFIFLFLAKGTSGIAGDLYSWMFSNIPFFWVFREPYAKFMPLVSLTGSVLMVLGMITSYDLLRSKKVSYLNAWYYPSIFLIVLLIIGPLLSRKVVWQINDDWIRSYVVEIPEEFEMLDTSLTSKGNYLVYPSKNFSDRHFWPSGYVGNAPLMFSNAKQLSISPGYIANPFVEDSIANIISIMLNDPAAFLETVARYNISGLLFQKDIYSPYVGDFSHIDVLYSDYKITDNDYYSVFEFGNENLAAAIPASKVTTVETLDHGVLESIFNPDIFTVYSKKDVVDPSYIINSGEDETSTFDLTNVIPGSYKMSIWPNDIPINEIALDKTPFMKDTIDINSECCSTLDVVHQESVDLNLDTQWLVNTGVELLPYESSDNSLVFSTNPVFYYKKIEDFNINKDYSVTLTGEVSSGFEGRLYIVERNPKTNEDYILIEKKLRGDSSNWVFNYKRSNRPYIEAEPQNYYVVINASSNSPSDFSTLTVEDLRIYEALEPKIVLYPQQLQKDSELMPISLVADRTSAGIVWLQTPEILSNVFIQFKEAYNPGWLMISLPDRTPSISEFINGIKQSSFALNMEDYSNTWHVREATSSSVFLLLFVPSLISNTFYVIGIVTSVGGCIVIWVKHK